MVRCQEITTTCDIEDLFTIPETVKKRKRGVYYNVSASFDIETTSFEYDGYKCGLMYVWAFNMQDVIVTGRTWEEFVNFTGLLSMSFGTGPDCKLVIYVHNLAFEFQFMREHFIWESVFSLDARKPVKATTITGIEFRCSYVLSGLNLAKTAENLTKHNIKKLKGDLDYSFIRHSGTYITYKEWRYIYNDVLIVTAYIDECIDECGDITKIPMTNTGRVREYVRKKCLPSSMEKRHEAASYRKLMRELTMTSDEYKVLLDSFQGGFTHGNAHHIALTRYEVASYDFTSSYPAVMLAEQYPMGAGVLEKITSNAQFIKLLKCYCCVFQAKFTNIREKLDYDNPLSESRCSRVINSVVNNGRIVRADSLITTMTDVDYATMSRFYEWDSIEIGKFYRYKRGYLPKPIIESVLDFYEKKTTLKGVKGKEAEYLLFKGMLNSIYGMCVTNIVRDNIEYNETGWNAFTANDESTEEEIVKYNGNKSRFLYYPWGVFITAYARRNLFTGIVEFGDDYIYSDTDSIKVLNHENHKEYFDAYNEQITKKITRTLQYYNIDTARACPETIDHKKKPIGVWDFEGVYSRFKTLGAKRYITEKKGEVEITVAGVGKGKGSKYMSTFDDPFEAFKDKLLFPNEATGKMTHTYIDDKINGYLTDYNGVNAYFETKSGIYLQGCVYFMSISSEFSKFLDMVR